MIWQDWVIMVCNFGFSLALIPTIRGHHKPKLSSCIITMTLLVIMVICFASLNLWFSAISGVLSVVAWVILAVQKWRIIRG